MNLSFETRMTSNKISEFRIVWLLFQDTDGIFHHWAIYQKRIRI